MSETQTETTQTQEASGPAPVYVEDAAGNISEQPLVYDGLNVAIRRNGDGVYVEFGVVINSAFYGFGVMKAGEFDARLAESAATEQKVRDRDAASAPSSSSSTTPQQ